MKISVTEQDIKKGFVGECRACPIALAIERATGRVGVAVARTYVNLGEIRATGYHDLADLPESARSFIQRFDSRNPVEPFEFELEVQTRIPYGWE